MIDIGYVRTHPEEIKTLCRLRGCDVDVDRLIDVDAELRGVLARIDTIRRDRKQLDPADREHARDLKAELAALENEAASLRAERDDLWARLPNLLAPDTPPGTGERDNVELYRWGEPPVPANARTHDVIGEELGILDLKRGARVTGSGYYYWKGDGAKLLWSIFTLATQFLLERDFELLYTPVVARKHTLFGTGYLPFSQDELYKLEGEDLYLIGTSEQTLVGLHTDEILDPEVLPLRYTAFTPCFRTEAGAYGRKARGAFRVHQFHKLEQIVFCEAEDSEDWHLRCQRNAEDFMQLMELPYRVVRVCVGDLGAPGYKKYDIEGWFAGFGEYRETHSNTNLLDYQTRRLKTRYRSDGETRLPHTISATMITDRAALAILENNQQEDGSILVPKALQPFMGVDLIKGH